MSKLKKSADETHLLSTLESVLGGDGDGQQVLVGVDERVGDGDKGRVVEG